MDDKVQRHVRVCAAIFDASLCHVGCHVVYCPCPAPILRFCFQCQLMDNHLSCACLTRETTRDRAGETRPITQKVPELNDNYPRRKRYKNPKTSITKINNLSSLTGERGPRWPLSFVRVTCLQSTWKFVIVSLWLIGTNGIETRNPSSIVSVHSRCPPGGLYP